MIRRQVVMPVTPERLWEALTDPDQLAGWFGARVEWDLRTGGAGPVPGRRRHRASWDGSRPSARAGTCASGGGQQERSRARPRWRANRPVAGCPKSATSWSNGTREPDSRSRNGRSSSPAGAGPQARPASPGSTG